MVASVCCCQYCIACSVPALCGLTQSASIDPPKMEEGEAGLAAKPAKVPCTFIKKKKKRGGAARKRVAEDAPAESLADNSDEGSDDGPAVVAADRKGQKGLNTSTTRVGKREKRVRLTYESTRSAMPAGNGNQGATATLQTETEFDRDAQAIFERQQAITTELKDKADDKIYRGLNGYQMLNERTDTVGGNAYKGATSKGPVRASMSIRNTVRWDYAPDICKDYKETGFCGYGDSCKFLHDRSDYKLGWQIDAEIDGGRYAPRDRGGEPPKDIRSYEIDSDSDDDADGLPFACFICREPWIKLKSPVMTKCKHYFCEKCALEHFRKSNKCFVCATPTGGVFKPAKEILKKKKEEESAENGQAADAGAIEEASDEE
eukprot:m.31192 g.31192  ORF g.31192 m.31192 type:complete len:375 (-) comp12296_c0_seq1:2887-4011(-)